MGSLKIGDIVARKSYGQDVFFKVVDIKNDGKEKIITLKGITYRIEADAPESDLIVQPETAVNEYNTRCYRAAYRKADDIIMARSGGNRRSAGRSKKALWRDTAKDSTGKFTKPGKVLHIDGDDDYLSTCLEQYKKFGIEVVGKYVPEKDQPGAVYKLLQEHRPDILVLTGHDGVIKNKADYDQLDNYKNTKYFIEAVKEARRYSRDLDSLVIFAGACQSLYKELIDAGANYASSPYRVLIHALDPVFICQKVAFTSFTKIVDPSEAVTSTITGKEGVGGIQTRGKYRDGYPLESYPGTSN